MKKSMLLMAIGCLLPMSTTPLCFKYIEGPVGLEYIHVSADSTKAGSYSPTEATFSKELLLGNAVGNGLSDTFNRIPGDDVFVTIRKVEIKRLDDNKIKTTPSDTTLVHGEKLKNGLLYEIIIDRNHKVTFRQTAEDCNSSLKNLSKNWNKLKDTKNK